MASRDAIAAARTALAAAEAAVARNAAGLAEARSELTELDGVGGTGAPRAALAKRLETLIAAREALVAAEVAARAEVHRLRDDTAAATRPEELVAGLDGQVPVALLPIRLETRFSADRRTLRIRVFPDQIHKDDHEPELTGAEREAGQAYWRARWAAGSDAAPARAAWQRLAAGSRPPRARWIVTATTPENIADLGQGEPRFADMALKPAPWTRAARAALLPERWVALGYRGDEEVLRAWGTTIDEQLAMGPKPEIEDLGPAAEGELPIDDGIRWLVDFETARQSGMALTVDDAEVTGGLAAGFDVLVVVGVDWSRDPAAGATALRDRLAAAAASDGVSFLPAGTPTNNTAGDSAGAGDAVAAFDPFDGQPVPAADGAGTRAERALGLGAGSALTAAPGAGGSDDAGARHMANALWPTTWGYFLDQLMRPLVSDATADAVREHFRDHVRGGGPLPTLRVGDQPYGLLPVVAAGAWAADDPVEGQIGGHVRAVRSLWSGAGPLVPALGQGDAADRDLVKLLRMTPRSASYRVRHATGPAVVAAGKGFEALAPFQELGATTFLSLVGIAGRPRLVDVTLDREHRLLPVPLVTRGDLSPTAVLDPNYVAAIASSLGRRGGFASIVVKPAPPQSILEALLGQSAQIEVADAAAGLVVVHELGLGTLQTRPAQIQVRERELHGIEPDQPPAPPPAGQPQRSLLDSVGGALELTELEVPAISGTDTLADHLAAIDIDALTGASSTRRLGEFRASLEYLATLPTAELDRLAAETLDCCSHRLDAWLTSLATRRLEHVRDTVAGTYVGGYGWVEDVRPRADGPSFGYVHAPSIPQASSAAILRSGHLGRRADAAGALALDLSSQRVARALELLDGMRQGQPIGALLGYRFERGLRDRRIELAGYTLALRQAAPLATADDGFADARPVEAIAARDVVDGLKLLDLWHADENGLFTRVGLPPSGADRDDVRAELAALGDLLDAVADLLLAESVHQMVAGSDERAGAALDALDRQTPLPDVGVARTPRTGTSTSHRLLIALHDGGAPAGWASDPRAVAEPRLNGWAARLLGDPGSVQFEAVVRDAAGAELERVQATLADLALSPLATVLATGGAGGSDRATELESRLGLVLAANVTAPGAAALELLADPPAGAPAVAIGLGELLAVAREVLDLAGACRPANAGDLVLDSQLRDPAPIAPGYDDAELERRADAAVAALAAAVGALPAAGANATAASLARHLLAAADAGVPGAVPTGDDRDGLSAQIELVRAAGAATLAAVRAAEAGFDRPEASPAARVAHDLERLRAVFGEAFPAAAVFTAANADALGASLADATALLGGDALAPATWLHQHALARPSAARLATVLSGAEALGRDVGADQLQVAQLPHSPGARWIGLRGERPAGSLAIVVHTPDGLQPDTPLAAWIVDAWQDVVPNASETTGVSFHFDAPGARAPQAVLLAVPPSAAAASWSLETLAGSVREALDLARMRGVGLDDLAAAPRFLPAIYLAFNLEGKAPSIDLGQIVSHAIELDNAAFTQQAGGSP
jgi:hypothetical protein